MTGKLITPDRIKAGCHINRWRGWTSQPISIIMHSVAMHQVIKQVTGNEMAARGALLHDLHETEFVGDVPTPDKKRYMQTVYYSDVDAFDEALGDEAGMPRGWQHNPVLKAADRIAVIAENRFWSMRKDPDLPQPDDWDEMHLSMIDAYVEMINRRPMRNALAWMGAFGVL